MQEFNVTQDSEGFRADVFLAGLYPQFSRAVLAKLFDGRVTVNGKVIKSSHKLKAGDVLHVEIEQLNTPAPTIQLPILYEDKNVLVINKPSGVLTHSKGALNHEGTVATFIKSHLSADMEDNNRAGIVHRLDRGTSGVIICAKNKAAQQFLQKQFSTRKAKKIYHAIVLGFPQPESAIIDVPIERHPVRPQTFRAGPNGKAAQTRYKLVKKGSSCSMLELAPTTGRTHQLRVHLTYLGHPILGDTLYGTTPATRLMLHASSLELTLPDSQPKKFEAPLPKEFADTLKDK